MICIILAGGEGKRMNSDIPKVLHQVLDPNNKNIYYPMIILVIMRAIELNTEKIFIIVGKNKSIIEDTINSYTFIDKDIIEYIIQDIAQGTGHAILCALPFIEKYNNNSNTALILSGDVPAISIDVLNNLINESNKILITELENPTGCGRIILNDDTIIKIVEEKDCTYNEKNINLVNCGIYNLKINNLINYIPLITNNNKSKEYYLTDIIDILISNNYKILYHKLCNNLSYQVKNVNTCTDLIELNNILEKQ